VQVRAADVRGGDADDGIERLFDPRVRDLLDGDLERRVVKECLHRCSSAVTDAVTDGARAGVADGALCPRS